MSVEVTIEDARNVRDVSQRAVKEFADGDVQKAQDTMSSLCRFFASICQPGSKAPAGQDNSGIQ